MGNIRPYVKEHTGSESIRKAIYKEILDLGMRDGRIPEGDEVEEIIKRINNDL